MNFIECVGVCWNHIIISAKYFILFYEIQLFVVLFLNVYTFIYFFFSSIMNLAAQLWKSQPFLESLNLISIWHLWEKK